MRHTPGGRSTTLVALIGVLLTVSLVLVGCGDGGGSSEEPETGESTRTSEAPGVEEQAETLEDLEPAEVLGVEARYTDTVIEAAADGTPQAVATVETEGEGPDERAVLSLISEMIVAAPDAPGVTVVLWIPGEPDARFKQYEWSRPDLRLERFEASIPASEFSLYAPSEEPGEDGDQRPAGFEAGRTGVMGGVDAGRLSDMASGEEPLAWESDTP